MFFTLQRITIFVVELLQKNTIVLTIHIIYNCHNQTERMFYIERNVDMNKKQELIERIQNLTDEQFELFITLYSQQEQESVQVSPIEHQTFLQPCV